MSSKPRIKRDKLAVASRLKRTPKLAKHIPQTESLSKDSLERMLKKHTKVYLKPNGGRKSRGIIRIERLSSKRFKIRRETYRDDVHSKDLWPKVKRLTRDKTYLVQQAIDSKTKERHPFDLRCHALRIDGKWKIGGICGRMGKRGSIITTSLKGGTPVLIETLLTKHLKYSRREKSDMIRKLETCILKTVKTVSPMYPRLKEFAVDIGIDSRNRIWIYEVNLEPLLRGNFRLLPDKTLYRRIRRMRKIAK